MNQEYQLLFFRVSETSCSGNQPLIEISRNPSNYLPRIDAVIYRHYVLNYRIFYDQCALSPQSLSAKSIYFLYWLWQEIESFLMQIISHMTDGNQFLNRGISFSLRKPTRWKIYLRQPQHFSQDNCRSTHQLIVRFFSLNPGLSNR